MRIRWRGLELPSRVQRDEAVSTDTYGKFSAEPFERGFGTTVGNSLRRILLSSLEGAAVTHIRLKGADHEFSSLPGVMEDVTDIILNVKSLIVKLDADEPKEMRLTSKKQGPVTAGMIEADPSITIVNKDLVIATLMIPAAVTFVPSFVIVSKIGWLNSYQGLIVPVIHRADQCTMMALCRAIQDLAQRARTKQLSPDDVQHALGERLAQLVPVPFPQRVRRVLEENSHHVPALRREARIVATHHDERAWP